MRHKFLLSILSFLLGLLLVGCGGIHQVVAQETPTPLVSGTQEVMGAEESDQYQLPYPGLLPDSPFYFLKTTRDRVVSFLISDPLKRVEFNLLQADKRLAAGMALIKKKKDALGESTIAKGENYFELALENAALAQKEGLSIQDVARKLVDSSQKHQAVLEELEGETKGSVRAGLRASRKRVVQFEKTAQKLLGE